MPLLRTEAGGENRSARGAYVLAEADGARRVTFLATGSEVGLAMTAREALAKDGIAAAVVSMPCWELFEPQPGLPECGARHGAAGREQGRGPFGWDRWLRPRSAFIGMRDFGASAPRRSTAFRHHGGKVAEAARSLL